MILLKLTQKIYCKNTYNNNNFLSARNPLSNVNQGDLLPNNQNFATQKFTSPMVAKNNEMNLIDISQIHNSPNQVKSCELGAHHEIINLSTNKDLYSELDK